MSPILRYLGLRGAFRATAGFGLVVALAAGSQDAEAQQIPVDEPEFVSAGGDPNTPDLNLEDARRAARSQFNLSAAADQAWTGMRLTGTMTYFMSNAGPGDYQYDPGYLGYLNHRGNWRHNFFEITMAAAVPRSTWQKYKDVIPSLQNIRNENGYSAAINGLLLGAGQHFRGADNTLGQLFSGIPSTDDGSCTDYTAGQSGFLDDGVNLLAGSSCPPTWPSGGWKGGKPINQDSWVEFAGRAGSSFSFDWWRVPEDLRQGGFLGNFQTYGLISDHWTERLADFGTVVPGGSGDPVFDGYPLGLDVSFDAFNFTLPTVSNVVFWRATVINNSAAVYGTGIDYDSLYLGFSPQPSNSIQRTATYYEPQNGSVRWVTNGVHENCNGASTANGVGGCVRNERSDYGFFWGASQMIVLNSPIGDLRNKLLTNSASPFFNPSHPQAGDTITYNHGHICGYGGCAATTFLTGQARRTYGMLSSTAANVLDGRPEDALSTSEYWRSFHSAEWPARTGFNKYVPGDWSYSNRPPGAPAGPDTLYLDSCLGTGSPDQACVETWSDSLPGGHNNRYGNVQIFGMGPFPLAAGDTTKITLAVMVGSDSVHIEDLQRSVIELYQNFWLSPEPPTPPTIVATDVTPGNTDSAQVTLFLDDRTDVAVDPFLVNFHKQLTTAPEGTALARTRELNPWLADSVLARAENNARALYIYKSCNGGVSWTDDADCIGDPANDELGNPIANGWRPATILEPNAAGEFPNRWTDNQVAPGLTYIYSISAASRGATWTVLDLVNGELVATELEVAPRLLAPLAGSSSDPNVARVYVPASIQAGGARATVAVDEDNQQGFARVPFNNLDVNLAGEPGEAGTYRVVFFDAATISSSESGTSVVIVRGDETESYNFPSGDITTINAAGATTTTEGGVTVTEIDDLGILLVRESDNAPLLVSTDLTGTTTTPGSFIARSDFPNFVVEVDNRDAGEFAEDFYRAAGADTTILSTAEPSPDWVQAEADQLAGDDAVGEYVFTWAAGAYGPDAPFTVTFGSPVTTSQAVQASLNARATAETTAVSEDALAVVKAAIVDEFSGSGFDQRAREAAEALTTDDLVAAKLPFSIENATYNRDVTAVMLKRTVRAKLEALAAGFDAEGVALRQAVANQITLGSGVDVQSGIEIPADTWIPGDALYFIETVDGEPTATWGNALVACSDPRASCNPVRGRGASAYVDPEAGQRLVVRYFVPFTSESQFQIVVQPAVSGDEIVLAAGSLEDVNFVPNPYLGRNRFEQGGEREAVAYFVNMPPQGVLRIYTVSGQFVQEVTWTEADLTSTDNTLQVRSRSSGDLRWDLRTREGNELAPGLYVFVVEAGGQKKLGKFVVIR